MAEKKTQLKIEVQVRDQATKAFETMGAAVKRFGSSALSTFTGLASKLTGFGSLLGAIAGAFSVQRLFAFSKEMLNLAQEVEDLAGAFGTTIKSMSEVAAVSRAYGVETDALSTSLKTFAKVVEEADEGSKKAQQTLARLGLTAKDIRGAGKDLVGQLSLVADGLGRLDGSATKATTATELFGRQGLRMLQVLGDGSEKFKGIIADAERFGAVIDRDAAQKAVEAEAEMAKLDLRLQGMGQKLQTRLVPALKKAGLALLDFVAFEKQAAAAVDRIEAGGFGIGPPIKGDDRDRKALRDAVAGSRSMEDRMRESMAGMKDPRADVERIERAMEEADVRMLTGRARRAQEFNNERRRELDQIKNDEILTAYEKHRLIEGLELEHARRMREVNGSVLDGLEDGLAAVADKWTDFYSHGRAAAEGFANALESGFSAASQAFLANTKNMEEAWKAFGREFIRVLAEMITKVLAAQLVGIILKGLFPSFVPGGGGAPGVTTGGGGGGGALSLPGGGGGPQALPGSLGLGGGGGFGDGGRGGGGSVTVNFNINTIDSKSLDQMLIERRKTIEAVIETAVERGTNRGLSSQIKNRF